MEVSFEKKQLPDGFEEMRRYENGQLIQIVRHRSLPSGVSVMKRFTPDGTIAHEIFSYGPALMLSADYVDGVKHAETYTGKGRLLSRKAYEKARAAIADMPAADPSFADVAAETNRWMREERLAAKRKAAAQGPDLERARKIDAFCESLLARGAVEDAYGWIDAARFHLGMMSVTTGRRWLTKLKSLQCPRVFACDVDRSPGGALTTGDLVIELPTDASDRSKVLAKVSRIAQEQGFDPETDHGQRYCYAKLD